jgi:exopolysaccharide production protein ExoQ
MEMRASSIDHRVGLDATEASATLKPIGQRLLDRAIDSFLVVWLFFATGAIIPLLVGGDSAGDFTSAERAFLRLTTAAPVVLIGPLLIVSRAKAITILLLRNPALLLLLLWVWCSVLWSIAPDVSMRRALLLTVTTLLGCYLIERHDLDWILRKFVLLYLTLLLAALLFILFVPTLSHMPNGQGLRAIFTSKNGMGQFLVAGVILLPPAIRKRLVHQVLGSAGLLIALALLIPVDSATAIVVATLVLASHTAIYLWRLPTRLAATVTAFGVATACLLIIPVVVNLDAIFELLGRDPTLTGRTELWRYAWEMVKQRPMIGYGYGAFFENYESATYVAAVFPWAPPSAHNGFLELLLDIGVIGLALFMVFIGSGLMRSAIAPNRVAPDVIIFLLPLLVAYTSSAIAESSLLGQSSLVWVLVVILTVSTTPNLAAIRSR